MANKIPSLTVILDSEYSPEDLESLISAIKMIKGVLTVASNPVGVDHFIQKTLVKAELRDKVMELFKF